VDSLEPGQATDGEALEGASAVIVSPLRPVEILAAQYTVTHALHGSYYAPLSPFSDRSMTTNNYDGVPLLFSARNPKLAEQVYASPDNGVTWEAMRGSEQAGERESMAPLVPVPLIDGTDYEPHEEQWHPGFVFLETDPALLAAAIAAPGTVIAAPARGAESLKITPLSDVPDAPVTVGQTGDTPAPDPATPAEPAPVVETKAIPVEHHSRIVEWIERVPSYLKVGMHELLDEFKKL